MTDSLFKVHPDGTVSAVANTYEGIKAALDGETLDFCRLSPTLGVYLDDNGINHRLPLNIPVSIYAGVPIYGPCVLAAADADSEGNTLPPIDHDVEWMRRVGDRWNQVVVQIMVRGSGDPYTYGSPDNLMGPIVLMGDELPEGW